MFWLLVDRTIDSEVHTEQANHFWLNGPIDAERLQQQILLNAFGAAGVDRFHSIRLTGRMELGSDSNEFFLLKKRLGLAYLKINMGGEDSMAIGVNPDGVWRRFEKEGKVPLTELLNGEEAESYRAIGHFFTPFMNQIVFRDAKINSIELSDDLGFQSIKVDYQNKLENCNSVAYLDINDLSELEGINYLDDNRVSRAMFFDYQAFAGVQVPMRLKYYRDDVLVQQVFLDKVSVNTGVLTGVFETPSDL